jgi:hypothetical protein
MKMKKEFVTPQVELISMDQTDVIATSQISFLTGKSAGAKARVIDCSDFFA